MTWTTILQLGPTANGDVEISLFADVRLAADGTRAPAGAGWSGNATAHGSIPAAAIEKLAEEIDQWHEPSFASRPQLGAKLFRVLTATAPGKAWLSLRDAIKGAGQSLRTRFEIVPSDDPTVPDLGAWPWELVRDDRNQAINRYLFGDPAHPASRLMRLGAPLSAVPWPLKVLVLVGPAEASKEIAWRSERRALLRLFASSRQDIEGRFLDTPKIADVQETLRTWKPHVVHFMGHGGAENGTSWLDLGANRGIALEKWTTEQIAIDLNQADVLAGVLNACRTGAGPLPVSIMNAFLQSGARAVVAMAHDISGASASRFGEALYTRVLAGEAIDAAMETARKTLQDRITGPDWVLPRLFISQIDVEQRPVETVLKAESRRIRIAGCREVCLDEHSRFVDRVGERAQLIEHLVHSTGPRAIWLKGPSRVGKTALARWCAERMLCHGDVVLRFLDFAPRHVRGLSWLDVLRRIRDGAAGPGLDVPIDHFSDFANVCNSVLVGNLPPSPLPPRPVIDQGMRLDLSRTPEKFEVELWTNFRKGLALWAGAAGRVLLAFDAFDQCDPSVRQELLPQLFVPIIEGKLPNVDLVVASPDLPALEDLRGKGLKVCPVPLFEPNCLQRLLTDYLDLHPVPPQFSGEHETFFSRSYEARDLFMKRVSNKQWSADEFSRLDNIMQALFG